MSDQMRHDHAHDETLNRFWNAVVSGDRAADAGGLDAEDAQLVRRLQRAAAVPIAASSAAAAWPGVLARIQASRLAQESATGGGAGRGNASVEPVVTGRAPAPRAAGSLWRQAPAQVATALLLLLTLGLGYVALGPGRPGIGRPSGLPVLLAPATPASATPAAEATPAVPEETLLEVAIPEELLPRGDRVTSELQFVTSRPGTTGIWKGEGSFDWPGVRVHHMVDGSLTVRAEGDAQVVRAGAGSIAEEAPAGAEVVLGPGDTWIARNETPFEAVNATDSPAELLLWVLADIEDPARTNLYPVPVDWSSQDDSPYPAGVAVPPGPVKLRIRRLELPFDGRLSPPPGGIQHGVRPPRNAAGTPIADPSVASHPNGTVVNVGRRAGPVYVLALEPDGPDTALPAAEATPNAGEETLLQTAIPAELIPEGDRITSEFMIVSSPGGSTVKWLGREAYDWPGVRVHYVLHGGLTVRAEGATRVLRAGAGSMGEEVPAGAEIVLAPGDTWIAQNEIPFEAVNPAESPAELLLWVLGNIEDPDTVFYYAEPNGWARPDDDIFQPGIEAPAGPATLRIRRLELPVEGRIPAPEGAVQQAVRPPLDAEGKPVIDPSVGTLPSGTIVNIGRRPVTAYILTLVPEGVEAGMPIAATPSP